LTSQRPKNTNKRPPSQMFLKEMAVVSTTPAQEATTTNSTVSTRKMVPVLPVNSTIPPMLHRMNNGTVPENSTGEFVRKEDFDQLQSAFDTFRQDMLERIKDLESRLPPKTEKR